MEMPVLARSLESSILSSTSSEVGSGAVEQLRRKTNVDSQRHGAFDPETDTRISPAKKKEARKKQKFSKNKTKVRKNIRLNVFFSVKIDSLEFRLVDGAIAVLVEEPEGVPDVVLAHLVVLRHQLQELLELDRPGAVAVNGTH